MDNYSKKTISMPVYSIQEGLLLGTVKSLLIDSKEKAVTGLIVERRRFNREERYIPLANVQSIGEDVITVDKALVADRRRMQPNILRQMRNPFILIGSRVFTVGGKTLGKVEEYLFDGQSGSITALEVGGGGLFKDKLSIKAQYITTMASGTIMVEDMALEEMETEGNNLFATVENAMENAMEKAGSVFNGTVNASKKISKNISQSFQKLKNGNEEEASLENYQTFEEPREADTTLSAESEKDSDTFSPVLAEEVAQNTPPAPFNQYPPGISKEELMAMGNVVIVERENTPQNHNTPPQEEAISQEAAKTNLDEEADLNSSSEIFPQNISSPPEDEEEALALSPEAEADVPLNSLNDTFQPEVQEIYIEEASWPPPPGQDR